MTRNVPPAQPRRRSESAPEKPETAAEQCSAVRRRAAPKCTAEAGGPLPAGA